MGKTTAKIIPFPVDRAKQINTRNPISVYNFFSKKVADDFIEYQRLAIDWKNVHRSKTIYEGYPFQPPAEPIRKDLTWYTDEQRNFGVWILNESEQEIILNDEIEFGWSPFVRKSTAPPHEPVHIQTKEIRKYLVWYVDKDGYGQYAMLEKNGSVWIPVEKTREWLK
jgi:hypothetical protein